MTNSLNISSSRRQAILGTLLALYPIVGVVVDLVAPSLPAIARALHTGEGSTQNVISFYLLGYAAGNFIAGILTDSLGRRKMLLAGLFGFVLVSLLPVIWPSISVLLVSRLLQGLTMGAVSVVFRAACTDLVPAEKMVKFGTMSGSLFALGPVVGPVLGGYLQVWFGWQAGFVFLAAVIAVMFLLVLVIVPETHFNRHPLNLPTLRKNLAEVLSHRQFIGLVVLMGAVYSLTISFNTIGPFLIQTRLHYSPIFFGHLALILGCIFMLSTFVCRWLVHHYKVDNVHKVAVSLLFLLALGGAVIGGFLQNNLVLLCVMSGVMFFFQGILFPPAMGRGMSLFRHVAGTATALMYLINISMTSLTGFVLSSISFSQTSGLLWVYLVLVSIAALSYWGLIRHRQ